MGQWEALRRSRVKVSNLVKRLNTEQVKNVFQENVGPVLQCTIVADTATLVFDTEEHALEAVQKYDGGMLEATRRNLTQDVKLFLYPKSSSSACLEHRLGALSACYLRRGEGWITVFRAAMTKQLKKEDGTNEIDFKGSFIKVCVAPSHPAPDAGTFNRLASLAGTSVEL